MALLDDHASTTEGGAKPSTNAESVVVEEILKALINEHATKLETTIATDVVSALI